MDNKYRKIRENLKYNTFKKFWKSNLRNSKNSRNSKSSRNSRKFKNFNKLKKNQDF